MNRLRITSGLFGLLVFFLVTLFQIQPAFSTDAFLQESTQESFCKKNCHKKKRKDQRLLKSFLDDLIDVMKHSERQPFSDPDLKHVQRFVNKWSKIENSHSDWSFFKPFLQHILSEFTKQLPPPESSWNPFSAMFGLYYDLAEQFKGSPIADLFSIPWNPPKESKTIIHEKKTVVMTSGYSEEFIKKRVVHESLNNELNFFELIIDDEVKALFIPRQEITILHEALKKMKKDRADPKTIVFWQNIINHVNDAFFSVKRRTAFDKRAFRYLTGKEKHLLSTHPLLAPENLGKYNVYQYYPGQI